MTRELDVIELLERDHRMIDGLVEQLESSGDPAEVRQLFLRIVDELSAHEAAEQQVVFPAFRSIVSTVSTVAESTLEQRLDEHEELNELLGEMRSLAPDGIAFVKRGSALLLEIKRHFELEELSVFAELRSAFDRRELVALAGRAAAVKRCSPAFPVEHPRVGVSPSGVARRG